MLLHKMNKLSKNLKPFKLITFDVTDTLLSFSQPPEHEYAQTARHYGYPNVDIEKLKQSFRPTFKYMSQTYPNYGSASMQWDQWWRMLIHRIFNTVEPAMAEHDLQALTNDLIEKYKTAECYTKTAMANELISKIQNEHKTIGIISNFDSRLKLILENTKFPKFDFVLASYDVGVAKPDERIFRLAESMCDGLKSNEALHIGNTPKLDYIGARKAGWHSVLITNNTNDWRAFNEEINELHVYGTIEEFLEKLENSDIEW